MPRRDKKGDSIKLQCQGERGRGRFGEASTPWKERGRFNSMVGRKIKRKIQWSFNTMERERRGFGKRERVSCTLGCIVTNRKERK
jgi:hypothetical protein